SANRHSALSGAARRANIWSRSASCADAGVRQCISAVTAHLRIAFRTPITDESVTKPRRKASGPAITCGGSMSETVEAAVAALNEKVAGGFAGVAKFVIEGEGAIMLDGSGARAGDEPADVTLTADVETFKGLLNGEVNPTS